MRRFFVALGIVFAVLIVVAAGLFAYLAYTGASIDKEARQYADESIVAITANWDAKKLRERATPELMKQVKSADLDNMFVFFATLGPLVEFGGSKQINWRSLTDIGSGTVIFARYAGVVKYREGAATITIELKKARGAWRVNALHVDSPKLIENRVGRGS